MGGDLWSQFHEGVRGWQPLNDTYESLSRLDSLYAQTAENLQWALGSIRTTYTGQASDAMAGAFNSLTADYANGNHFALNAAIAAYQQSSNFALAQQKIQK